MDKRYQVFVSSTYADLKDERQKVIQALMEMDCIPAGMEIFPAADEEQLEFIKKVIDDCDYYLLIIGGRYGSTDAEGVSYTEKEYDYAVHKGIPVIAMLHSDPGQIPSAKTDRDDELARRLDEFRQNVSQGRLVKYWHNADQLPGLVALSHQKTIKTHPAVGWVRADQIASEDLYKQVSELSKENTELRKRLSQIDSSSQLDIPNLAGLDDSFEIHGTYTSGAKGTPSKQKWSISLTWGEIFGMISPYLLENPSDNRLRMMLRSAAFEQSGHKGDNILINDQCYQTIKIQFTAMGLMQTEYLPTTKGDSALFWSLTEKGKSTMMQLRAIRKESN
jgi:hypothetical protein